MPDMHWSGAVEGGILENEETRNSVVCVLRFPLFSIPAPTARSKNTSPVGDFVVISCYL